MENEATSIPVETALFFWVSSEYDSCRCGNGILLQKKAKQLQQVIKSRFLFERWTNLKLSNGWLHKLQGRFETHSLKSHSNAGDANNTATKDYLQRIQRVIAL